MNIFQQMESHLNEEGLDSVVNNGTGCEEILLLCGKDGGGMGRVGFARVMVEKASNDNVAKENLGKPEARNSQSTQGSPKQTPAKKAWSVHGEVISAIRRSANKYSMFELYNESEIDDLQNVDMITYYKRRKAELIDKGKKGMEGNSTGSQEKDDVLEDDTSIAKCMAEDGMEGIDGFLETHIKNSEHVNVSLVHCAKQSMLCEIMTVNGNTKILCTFVYAANGAKERRESWKDLMIHKRIANNQAWIMMGDMNVTLNPNEHSVGSSSMTSDMNEFKECINDIEMEDVVSTGLFFTWTKNLFKTKKGDSLGVHKKLDRIMRNEIFIDKFSQAYAVFHPYLISDHCPNVITIPKVCKVKRRAFKFVNFVAEKEGFLPIVQEHWLKNYDRCHMFNTVKKLKSLKHDMRKLTWKDGNIFKKV
ncbi:RNA-directed DNA polymerase, eukaryota, reverse transcriptase zinc-binding domain protein [Tanacetum coccineum]